MHSQKVLYFTISSIWSCERAIQNQSCLVWLHYLNATPTLTQWYWTVLPSGMKRWVLTLFYHWRITHKPWCSFDFFQFVRFYCLTIFQESLSEEYLNKRITLSIPKPQMCRLKMLQGNRKWITARRAFERAGCRRHVTT